MDLDLMIARNYGIEAEVNATDGKAGPFLEEFMPAGIYYIADKVCKIIQEQVQIRKWGATHWLTSKNPGYGYWVVKPDGSCGLEVCSPISRGWYGLSRICQVIEGLGGDEKITVDRRCSLHVHVDVSDCTPEEVGNILTYWIKCEPFFIDTVPSIRKCNRYCQYIGLWDWCDPENMMSVEGLVRQLGKSKYYSCNTYHLHNGNRATIEFRLGESDASKNPWTVKNWVRLLLHFVERTKKAAKPGKYKSGDQWSSYLWLDPRDVFHLLGFDGTYELSPGLVQVRNWVVARIIDNCSSNLIGVYSIAARRIAQTQINEIATELIEQGVNLQDALNPFQKEEALYGKMFRV